MRWRRAERPRAPIRRPTRSLPVASGHTLGTDRDDWVSSRGAVCGTAIGPSPASALVVEQPYAEPLALGGARSVAGSGAVLARGVCGSGSGATYEDPPPK